MLHRTASRREVLSWTLFDFANTGFYVIIITVIYPKFFTGVIAGGNDAYWEYTISASMLLTALIGPMLGAIADASHRRKPFLGFFTAACVAATALLYTTGPGTFWPAVILVVIANIGFEGGTIFYDAFLPDIAAETDYSRISGYGFAMGYLGSFIILIMALPLVSGPDATQDNVRLTFLMAAAFFALFSIPLFLNVRERQAPRPITGNPISAGYARLRTTFAHIRQYDAIRRFLLAYFVYNDSILTVIVSSSLFASKELGFTTEQLIYVFMVVQGSALAGSLVFGSITNRIGARQSIAITLCIWIGVVVSAFFVTSQLGFFIIAGVAGIALGSSQSGSRTLMTLMTPDEKRTEFFGFYDGFFGKASAVVGPLVFGFVTSHWNMRGAMLIVGAIFVLGLLLLFRVPDVRVEEGPTAA